MDDTVNEFNYIINIVANREGGEVIGRMYGYFEPHHGDNYIYHILPQFMDDFEQFVSKKRNIYRTLEASVVALELQKIEDPSELRGFCAVPREIRDNLYVVVYTPRDGREPFLERCHDWEYE
jgi:hypothetical protein